MRCTILTLDVMSGFGILRPTATKCGGPLVGGNPDIAWRGRMADFDPLQTSGASLRSRPHSISGEGGGDLKSRNLIEKCSLRLVARNTAYMLRLLTPCRPLHRCFPHQEAAIWIPVKSFVSPFSQV